MLVSRDRFGRRVAPAAVRAAGSILLLLLLIACRVNRQPEIAGADNPYEGALALYQRNQWQETIDLLQRSAGERLPQPESTNLLGMSYQQLENHEAAIVQFSEALAVDPTFVDALNNRAISYQALGDFAHAEDDLRAALALDSTFAMAHYNLGVLLYARAEYGAAAEHLVSATSHAPNDSDAWYQLGLTYDRLGSGEQAVGAFSRAIEIEQGFDDQSYYLRGIVYAELGEFALAEADFDEAINKGLRNVDTLFYRGLMRYWQDRFEEARQDFEEAAQFDPFLADVHYYLGFTYAELGDSERAQIHAQRALDLDPPVDYGEEP